MSPSVQFLFYSLAAACFFWEAFLAHRQPKRIGLVALGWLLFSIPFAYNAAQAWL